MLGDATSLALWGRFRDLSIEKYTQIYARLNIEFDVYSGESQYSAGMKRSMKLLGDKKLLEDSNGAIIVNMEAYKLGVGLVQKADGATLYLTRDIAAATERYEQFCSK